eukprot:CAMPEP_0119519730 /NCGR_PEP_ID=MMETSP1344-20130328/35934_1 /TAXON_ID=236787 /ORGANISM="Florenciella parvula, Strain CCMP2471" /LENGTH=73 /DNA_ID=CAMNT_0007557535 /DNA_START=528 /DNA_END=749 /DNA_ORIENTATION=-
MHATESKRHSAPLSEGKGTSGADGMEKGKSAHTLGTLGTRCRVRRLRKFERPAVLQVGVATGPAAVAVAAVCA